MPSTTYRNTLVTDFDGTLTRTDFFQAVLAKLVDDKLAIWNSYCRGSITHFEALAGYYKKIRISELKLRALVTELGFPNNFATLVNELRQRNWDVVIASAGCEWYIDQLVKHSGILPPPIIHSNHGTFSPETGLVMELPISSPHFHPKIGISKASVVKSHSGPNRSVAFAGDGPTDLEPALLTEPNLRFAKGALASLLSEQKENFIPFEDWEEIPKHILRVFSK